MPFQPMEILSTGDTVQNSSGKDRIRYPDFTVTGGGKAFSQCLVLPSPQRGETEDPLCEIQQAEVGNEAPLCTRHD